MAKKNGSKELDLLKQDWHDSVVDDTPDKKFVPKSKKIKDPEEPEYEDAPIQVKPVTPSAEPLPTYQWVDDWTLLSEVTKINKEYRGAGANKKFVNVFYGPLR